MKYLDLDNNVKVSCIGIGCMRISGMSARDADTLVHTALDEGINFFDHADIYGGGKSEEIFGKILADQPALREKMFIQSKCAIHDGLYDFSGKYIKGAVDGILARLRTDHIDSLLLHRPDPLMEPEEVGEAFDELERSGKVLHFGVSNMNRYQMELLASGVRQKLWANQLQMSLAHSPLINEGINVNTQFEGGVMRGAGTLEYCRLNRTVVQTWSPLQKGFFGGVFLGDSEFAELNRVLEELARKYGVTADAIAYAWLLRYPARMQVVLGTTNPERVKGAAEAAGIVLTKSEWYTLYKAAGNKLP